MISPQLAVSSFVMWNIERPVNTPFMQTYNRQQSSVQPEIGGRTPAFVIRGRRGKMVECQLHQRSHMFETSGLLGDIRKTDF